MPNSAKRQSDSRSPDVPERVRNGGLSVNSSDSIGPHLGAQDRAAWVQIALNPAGMGASFGWHELHDDPSRQPVDCHKITGRRCILVNESMIQPSLFARACCAAIKSRSIALAMKKRQTARFIAKVQIRHLSKIGNDLDLATFIV